jgi:hypothetical protein
MWSGQFNSAVKPLTRRRAKVLNAEELFDRFAINVGNAEVSVTAKDSDDLR